MKHAGPEALRSLAPCLADLRRVEGLVEKKTGVFYRGGRSCLHFHEDPAGLFVDVRLDGDDFERRDVTTRRAQQQLVRSVRAATAATATRSRRSPGAP